MKITQAAAAFQPVTVVFDDIVELKSLVSAMDTCIFDALREDHDHSAGKLKMLYEKLKVFVK